MRDFALNIETHDIAFINGDLVPVDGLAAIEQELRISLLMWKGEWFLDRSVGTDYLGRILGKQPQIVRDAEIKRVIAQVDGVVEIIEYTTSVNRITRALSVAFTATTEYGEIESSLPLGTVTRITRVEEPPPPVVVPPVEVDLYELIFRPLPLDNLYTSDNHPALGGAKMSIITNTLDLYDVKPHSTPLNSTPEP